MWSSRASSIASSRTTAKKCGRTRALYVRTLLFSPAIRWIISVDEFTLPVSVAVNLHVHHLKEMTSDGVTPCCFALLTSNDADVRAVNGVSSMVDGRATRLSQQDV